MNIELGSFSISSGKVLITDPCYEDSCAYRAKLDNVKCGTWFARLTIREDPNEERVSRLVAMHQNYLKPRGLTWKNVSYDIGVDSGMAGVFDINTYRDDLQVMNTPRFITENGFIPWKKSGDIWFAMCADAVHYSNKLGGVVTGGCVSSTGYGDGVYKADALRNGDGEVVGIRIIYL